MMAAEWQGARPLLTAAATCPIGSLDACSWNDGNMETIACVVAFGGMLLILVAFANGAWWGHRLHRILQQKYPSTWAEITTLWGMSGMHNPFRAMPWLVGPDYCGDEEVRRLKKASLWSSALCLVAITGVPWMVMAAFIVLAILKRILEGS